MPYDSEGRTFELDERSQPTLFNSTELRCIDVKMLKEKGSSLGVPIRRSLRHGSQVAAMARDAKTCVRVTTHVLPAECEGLILGSLW